MHSVHSSSSNELMWIHISLVLGPPHTHLGLKQQQQILDAEAREEARCASGFIKVQKFNRSAEFNWFHSC